MVVSLAGFLVLDIFSATQFTVVSLFSADHYITIYGTYYCQLHICEFEGKRKTRSQFPDRLQLSQTKS